MKDKNSKQNSKKSNVNKDETSAWVYPMRINKYLARKGISTRVGADLLVKEGKVLINGKKAQLGDKVSEKDRVEVKGAQAKNKFVYFAYNKPKGTVSTNPQGDEKSIMQSIKIKDLPRSPSEAGKAGKVFPVGRLDKDSYGLMILTNDGRVTDRLLNPIYDHEKEYVVEVDRKFTPGFLRNMQDGVLLDDAKTKPAKVSKVSETIFKIILTEGRNRQIRRMTEKLGYTVRDLKRTRVQNIELGKISSNSHREIKGEELVEFLKSIKLT